MSKHTVHSSYREKLLEHLFVSNQSQITKSKAYVFLLYVMVALEAALCAGIFDKFTSLAS